MLMLSLPTRVDIGQVFLNRKLAIYSACLGRPTVGVLPLFISGGADADHPTKVDISSCDGKCVHVISVST